MSKKIKNEIVQPKVEPESCSICSDRYTAVIRRKIICKYCQASACAKCIEQYLLTRHEDAHCLHCRVNYNDTSLQEICTKTYLQQTYYKHRQEVLVNRERANLPGLQELAQRTKHRRDRYVIVERLNEEKKEIKRAHMELCREYSRIHNEILYMRIQNPPQDTTDLDIRFRELSVQIRTSRIRQREKNQEIYNVRTGRGEYRYQNPNQAAEPVEEEKERKKFIRRCTRDGCQGFLSTAWKCALCEWYSCATCFAVKSKEHDAPHECNKEDVEMAEMIKKDSKPCPKCGEFITKSSGCFAEDTPILCWNGTIKMSQDIVIGDELVGDDGTKRIVLDTLTGEDTMYEVKQNNGMTYVVNSEHTLVLKMVQGSVIIHIPIKDYLVLPPDAKQKLYGFRCDNKQLTMISITEIGKGTYYGWSVDQNKRFQLLDTTCVKNCDQMFCICCQTPFSWNTGQIVTNGIIHNPHYYEWLRRNGGGTAPRNPADVPCGGYPAYWELVDVTQGARRMYGNGNHPFYEFHRLCMEIQEISQHRYRSHIDQNATNQINVRFLLNEINEKKWGQLLAQVEKKRKRDQEIQEILGAFRMVAVELINRIQLWRTPDGRSFASLSKDDADAIMNPLLLEMSGLIHMINEAFQKLGQNSSVSVPQIVSRMHRAGHYYYCISYNKFRKIRSKCRSIQSDFPTSADTVASVASTTADAEADADDSDDSDDSDDESIEEEPIEDHVGYTVQDYRALVTHALPVVIEDVTDDEELQQAIQNSLDVDN